MSNVVVIGAGIGGLSLALALRRRGLDPVVLERAPMLTAVGAGLQLGPNAVRVLAALGLEAPLLAASIGPERAEVRDAATGRLLLANQLGDAAIRRWGAPYRVITRAALQALLLDAARAGGIELRLGVTATDLEPSETSVSVRLANGERVTGAAVIGCDGLHSMVRSAVHRPRPPRFTGQTAWRGLASMPTSDPPIVQVWTGPSRHFVRYPVGQGLVNLVAVTESAGDDAEGWDTEGERDRLAKAFADWPDEVRATIAAVERPWRAALYDRAPLERWSQGQMSLLGDAAHPMLPFLGQGAGMAIEDAWVMARRLAEVADPVRALQLYEAERKPRTSRVQAWSSRNARLFHLPGPLASGVFGAARLFDQARGADPEARFDWLYGWRPDDDRRGDALGPPSAEI